MFDDPVVPSKIRLYPQFNSDIGKVVNIRGLDSNYQPVLTNGGATVGESIVIQSPYVDSVTTWAAQTFHEVTKAKTIGYVRAYSYDASLPIPPAAPTASDTPLLALAVWEPTETLPDYRRSFIPALDVRNGGGACCNDRLVPISDPHSPCGRTRVTVIAKMKFIPVEVDTDFLPIGNAPALKLAMLAVMLEERRDYDGARIAMQGVFDPLRRRYYNGAIPLLDEELAAYQGDGVVNVVRTEGGNIAGAQLLNLI